MRVTKNIITVYIDDKTLNALEQQRGTTKKSIFVEQILMEKLGMIP